MKIRLLIYLLLISTSLTAQTYYTVVAKSGLLIRKGPSVNDEKIERLKAGTHLKLLKDTNIPLSIKDDGKTITANWFQVKTKDSAMGYVFSGYLVKNKTIPREGVECDTLQPCDTKIKSEFFDITFYNYQIEEEVSHKTDSINVFEYVFNDLSNKVIYIQPKQKGDKVDLHYSYKEEINELYNGDEGYNYASWTCIDDFKPLTGNRNFFVFNDIDYEGQEEFRQKQLKLRDTSVYSGGEIPVEATLIYKNKPCTYFITEVILKVVIKRNNKAVETKYINIVLSYGC